MSIIFMMCAMGADLIQANQLDCSVYEITQVCWSVTNYFPQWVDGKPVVGDGQTDGDPTNTAAGALIYSPEQAYAWVAGPLPLLRPFINASVSACFPWAEECFPVWDTFGAKAWQDGVFYHDYWGQDVIGIDIFTPDPHYYLECDGYLLIEWDH